MRVERKQSNKKRMKKSNARKKRNQKMHVLWGVLIAVGVLGISVAVALGMQAQTKAAQAPNVVTMPSATPFDENAVELQAQRIRASLTLLPGIQIAGVDVSGMTREDAYAALAPLAAQSNESYLLTLQAEEKTLSLDAEAMGRQCDLNAVISEALQCLGDIESDEALLQAVEEIETRGKTFDLVYSVDEQRVRAAVANFALDIGTDPVNAKVSMSDGKLAYTDDQPGRGLDADAQEAIVAQILQIGTEEKETIIPVTLVEIPATITREMIEGQYVLRGKFNTSFSGSTADRKFNVRKGADLINGTHLKQGETFSTNAVLGVRTLANGWKMAGAYVQGNTELQAGGGVCQLSSTLYNAVLLADLEIVNRRNHSMRVGYVKGGLDATINSVGNIIDFSFKNNTAGDILIVSYTEGNNLYMELYGLPMANDAYDEIKLSSKKTKTVSITTKETQDSKMPAGTSVVTREGKAGETWEAYKEYYKNGKLVKTELINTSTYGMVQTLVTVGTAATTAPVETKAPTQAAETKAPTAEPTPAPVVTDTPSPTSEPEGDG